MMVTATKSRTQGIANEVEKNAFRGHVITRVSRCCPNDCRTTSPQYLGTTSLNVLYLLAHSIIWPSGCLCLTNTSVFFIKK